MKQLSQKEFEKCPKWLKKPKTFHSKLETLRYETIPITFHLNFVGEKLFIILSVSVLSVSVSADMKIIISVFYRYRPIWKKAYRSYTDWVQIIYCQHNLFCQINWFRGACILCLFEIENGDTYSIELSLSFHEYK